MPLLHDDAYKAALLRRVESLTPDSRGQWGKMSVSQMLWHVNEAMESALGRIQTPAEKIVPLPLALTKFIVINMPWPKGARTLKRWMPGNDRYDFASERGRCVRLITEITAKPLDAAWPDSPTLGRMSGRDVSRLHAKHLNHHLTQFGV